MTALLFPFAAGSVFPFTAESGGLAELPTVRGVTIDSANPHEIDDAINVKRKPDGGYFVQVHISNAAALVPLGGDVEIRARRQMFSHYGPNLHIPILDMELVDSLLNLRIGSKRPVLTKEFEFDSALKLLCRRFYPAMLEVEENLTYSEVDNLIGEESPSAPGNWLNAYSLAEGLFRKRSCRAMQPVFDLDQELISSEDGRVRKMYLYEAFRSFLIVQELMILANSQCADFLDKSGVPFLYRNHSAGLEEQIIAALASLFDPTKTLDEKFSETNEAPRASFGPVNQGHNGLGLPVYGRFTSPLRSYPDLVNQQILTAILNSSPSPYDFELLREIAENANVARELIRRERFDRRSTLIRWLNAAPLKQLCRMKSSEYSILIAQVAQGKIELTHPRYLALRKYIYSGRLTPTNVANIIFSPWWGPDWDGFREAALAWLRYQPDSSIEVITVAEESFGWPCRDEIVWDWKFEQDDCVYSAKYVYEGREINVQGESRRDPVAAKRSAGMHLIQQLSGVEFPPAEKFPEITRSRVGVRNPNRKLNQYLEALESGEKPKLQIVRPSRSKIPYRATIELKVLGLNFSSGQCKGRTETEAVTAAVNSLLSKLPPARPYKAKVT